MMHFSNLDGISWVCISDLVQTIAWHSYQLTMTPH